MPEQGNTEIDRIKADLLWGLNLARTASSTFYSPKLRSEALNLAQTAYDGALSNAKRISPLSTEDEFWIGQMAETLREKLKAFGQPN